MTAGPYEWLVLDIETGDADPMAAERWTIDCYRPEAFGTWQDATIGRRIREAWQKRKERLALLNAAPIIVVSLRSETELRLLHCMKPQSPATVAGGLVEGFADAAGMLLALRALLDARTTPDTIIAGHNIRAFDLPKLRHAYLAAGLRLPLALAAEQQPVFDTMTAWRRFSVDGEVMPSVDDLLRQLGIESHKGLVDGRQIPELFKAGQHDAIVAYALADVLKEAELFLRMTGRWGGLK